MAMESRSMIEKSKKESSLMSHGLSCYTIIFLDEYGMCPMEGLPMDKKVNGILENLKI
eukprot:c21041_g1_i1 orf=385-558(+)